MTDLITKPDNAWLAELRKELPISRYRRHVSLPRPSQRAISIRVDEAISWGFPSYESTGCSSSEFVELLIELRRENSDLQMEIIRMKAICGGE